MADETRTRPTLASFRDMIIRETMLRIRTVVPARVLEYHDGPPSTVKLEISAQQVERDQDGNEGVRQPFVFDDVPVWQMGGVQNYIRVPLQTGDEGVILVCDRSIGSWRTDGLAHPPPAPWLHNLGECFFLPGFRPDTPAFQPPPATMDGMVVEAEKIQLGAGALPTQNAARKSDPVISTVAFNLWVNQVTLAINALAPGSVTPPLAVSPPGQFPVGEISDGSSKTFIE